MTTRTLKLYRFALAAGAGMVCLFITDNLSSIQRPSLITQADARIGRPGTPGSIAGVARRTDRRAYRRGAAVVGGAAIGTGAYLGYGAYRNGYGAYPTSGDYGYNGFYGSNGGYFGSTYGATNATAYCLQRFRSFDPGSGTYLGYDGVRHPCP